jgi:hypothetical protein
MMMQHPIFVYKLPWARERISPEIIENLGTRSQKGSLPLH